MLGQVVEDAEGMHAPVAEEFSDGRARVWRDVLQRGGGGGGGGDYYRIVHGSVFLEDGSDSCDGRLLLPYRHVYADEVLALLIDDGVDCYRCLAGSSVAYDEFALAPAYGDEGVDRLQTRLHGIGHRLPLDHVRGAALDRVVGFRDYRPLVVERAAQRVDHPPEERLSDGHPGDVAGPPDGIALADEIVSSEEDHPDVVLLQVEDHPGHIVGELENLPRHGLRKPPDPGYAVADL